MPQADWNHEGVAQIYAPEFPGNGHPEENGYSFTSDSTTGSTLVYGYGPQSIPATGFHLPGAPASAGKHLSSHRSAKTTGVEEEKHSRRIKRTRTACEECRKRKQKCDGGEPCQSCDEQSTDCKYRDVPPTKKDDSMEKMVKIAENYNKTLATLNSDIDMMNATLRGIEARLSYGLFPWQRQDGYADHSPSSLSPSFRRESE